MGGPNSTTLKNPNPTSVQILEIENLNSKPSGLGKVISYTIVQGRKNLEYGIVIGELEDKSRFVANVLGEESFLKKMTEVEMLETKGEVKHTSERNIFKPLFT